MAKTNTQSNYVNFLNSTVSNKVLTPSNQDVEIVTAFANYNAGSNSYSQNDVQIVLNLLYSEYLSDPNARVCWDAQEKMFTAVAAKRSVIIAQTKSFFRTKDQDDKWAQDFIRTVNYNFLSALGNGKITSVSKPQCLEKGGEKGDGTIANNQPPPPSDIFSDFIKNPYAVGGTVIGLGIIGYLGWKLKQP